ncbi:THAP domain-containing protein 2-like [Stegodyphus dumicola]|uniref:THAP domain-containing protein 2-like n=1 Tax=Stegodyphus dumicola TaxID=202533 RepID=UPI0015B0CEB9|nr:THAP domain-containing protein 2-like [Stegodyphus dumicola]
MFSRFGFSIGKPLLCGVYIDWNVSTCCRGEEILENMPFKCCVTGCRGNYKGTEKVHTFSFPKNDALRERWLRNIPRKDFSATPYSRVCHKHFQPDDLIWETSAFDEKNGKIIKASLQRPKLKEGAFPSIFDGCPSYFIFTSW